MAYKAQHRFARVSAKKMHPLATIIRGKSAGDALNALRYMPHRGARMLEKVLRSALSNAEDQGGVRRLDELVVLDARVDRGPMFKRIRPRARGMAYLIRRRTAHIRVILGERGELFE
jgi:large subunit ribosomal protein L22